MLEFRDKLKFERDLEEQKKNLPPEEEVKKLDFGLKKVQTNANPGNNEFKFKFSSSSGARSASKSTTSQSNTNQPSQQTQQQQSKPQNSGNVNLIDL